MKKIGILTIYLFIFCSALIFNSPADGSSDPETFTIKHPRCELNAPKSFFGEESMIVIYGPESGVSFNIITHPESTKSLKEYAEFSKEQARLGGFKNVFEGEADYNNTRFAYQIYSFRDGRDELKAKCFWTLRNKSAFILTYTAPEGLFEKYLKESEALMEGFEIDPPSIKIPDSFVSKNRSLIVLSGEKTGDFQTNINVIIEKETKPYQEFIKDSKEGLKNSETTFLAEGFEIFRGSRFYSAIHEFKSGDLMLKAKSTWTLQNGVAYILTYTSLKTSYEKQENNVEQIFKNFSIK